MFRPYTLLVVRARLLSLLAVLIALLATTGAWGATRVCRAEAEARACRCEHAAEVVDDCCQRQTGEPAVPGAFALLVPSATASAPVPRLHPPAASPLPPLPGVARKEAARAPPSVPRFLAIRTLLI